VSLVGNFIYGRSSQEKLIEKHKEEISSLKEFYLSELFKTQEEIQIKEKQLVSSIREKESKIYSLTNEVRDLKSKQKTSFYKIVKPDGTIELKKYSESEVNQSSTVITEIQQEFKEKIQKIENRWSEAYKSRLEQVQKDFSSKEEQYKSKISELEKSKTITVKQRKNYVELGYQSENEFYFHGSRIFFDPFAIGIHLSSDKKFKDKSIGLGIGIKF
jgi:hypothetical protein